MMYKEKLQEQINALIQSYPQLYVEESNNDFIQLRGMIRVFRSAKGFILDKSYAIEIFIPLCQEALPYVIDSKGEIDKQFIHLYTNGKLCLETDTAIRIRFINGMDLCCWMDEFVEPYFFSYEFYQRYGCFPFGERPHGFMGTIDTYQDLLHGSSPLETIKLITYAVNTPAYRGHALCPCQSGMKLRNCHGRYLLPFMLDNRYKKIITTDLENIRAEIETYEQTREDCQ